MPQIIPIKELKNTAEISDLCNKSEEPIYITKNGYGDMVIMSIKTYERMFKRLQIYRELEESEKDIREGRVYDAEEALEELRRKYDL